MKKVLNRFIDKLGLTGGRFGMTGQNVMLNLFQRLCIVLAVFAFVGCNNISEGSDELEGKASSAGKALVSLSVSQNSGRTIMPTNISEADVIHIDLSAEKIDSDGNKSDYEFQFEDNSTSNLVQWFSDDKKTAIANMQDSTVAIDYGTYTFTLELYAGEESLQRITQRAVLENVQISEETESLAFEAKYVDYGDLSLTIEFNSDFDIENRIGAVKAGLFTISSNGKTAVTGYDYEDLNYSELVANKVVSYAKSDIPNGTYYVKFQFYAQDKVDAETDELQLLNTITEIVKVHGYKTEKTIELDPSDLNLLYTVSYNLNDTGLSGTPSWKDGVEESLTTKRNIYTSITLPTNDDIKYSGYKLIGWCEKDSDENEIDADGDGKTDILTTIGTGVDTAKDYTLYAMWEKEEANVEFDISIKVDETSDIEVSEPTKTGAYISFTITPPDEDASYTYTWTVDGTEQEPIKDAETFEIDASEWATGVYDISLIAKEEKTDSESGETITRAYSYTAQIEWTKLYKVTFDMHDAPVGVSEVEPVYIAENAETKTIAEIPTDAEGNAIAPYGWYTDSDFTEEFIFGGSTVTKSLTLYGCWNVGSNIYVQSNGTDPVDESDYRGTASRQLKTIAAAVALMTESDVDYKIWIDGEIEGAQEIESSSALAKGGLARSITLIGQRGVNSENMPQDSLNGGFSETNPGRTLTVSTNVPVIIENLTITGGYLTSTGYYGGGLSVDSGADVTLTEYTKITGNTATRGGGVNVDGVLTMEGSALISDNTASALYGGGVHVGSSGVLDMQAGEIYDNDISGTPSDGEEKQGYGVYVNGSNGKLKMGGSAVIGNKDDTVVNDVYLASGTKIIVTSTLMGGVTTATITPAGYDTSTQWIEADIGGDGEPSVDLSIECSSFAVTPFTDAATETTTNWRVSSIGTLWNKIGDSAAPSAVGDIVFNDGSAIAYTDGLELTDEQKEAAVAVIFYVGTDDATSGTNENILGKKMLGVGIYNTQGETTKTLAWVSGETTGYTTTFTGIQLTTNTTAPEDGTIYYQYEYNSMFYLTGDFDGSDNWSKVCEQDPDGTDDAATNYPAFNWVNTYADSYNLTGEFAENWYLPSGVELRMIYDNKTIVNAALEAVGGTQIESGTNYFSSSQDASDNRLAYSVSFNNWEEGYCTGCNKNNDNSVCGVRRFDQ